MQVLTVLISPIFLGSYWAMLSQIEYISLGLAGLPVFSGFKSGFSALAGPTGGYIIGFVIASFVTGYIYIRLNPITSSNDKNPNYKDISQHKDILDNYENIDKKVQATAIACLCGLAVIYIFGYLHLLGYLSTFGINIGLKELAVKTFKLGVQPFIIIDLLKIMIIVNIQRVSGIKKLTA
jgi:biotin transporter BioY